MRSADNRTSEILARFIVECARATHNAIEMDIAGPNDFTNASYSHTGAQEAMTSAREALRFLWEALGGPKQDRVCICPTHTMPGRHLRGCPALGTGKMAQAVDGCALCGIPFRAGEIRAMDGEGRSTHEIYQPDSMKRCRDELVWQRDAARREAR